MVQGFSQLVKNSVIAVVFIIMIFAFVLSFLYANNSNAEILNSKYNLTGTFSAFNSTMSGFQQTANSATQQLGASTPSATQFLFLIFEAAFTIPKLFLTGLVGTINLIFTGLFPGLGGAGMGPALSIVFGMVIIIEIVSIVFLLIKTIRTGESEH